MGVDTRGIAVAQRHRQLRRVKLGLMLMGAALTVAKAPLAQVLADPAVVPATSRSSAGDRTAPAASGGQVIILSSTRKQVTLDGQTARLGERLGAATVTGITDSHLTMRIGGRTKRLGLYAGVEKRIKNPGPAAAAAVARREAAN